MTEQWQRWGTGEQISDGMPLWAAIPFAILATFALCMIGADLGMLILLATH